MSFRKVILLEVSNSNVDHNSTTLQFKNQNNLLISWSTSNKKLFQVLIDYQNTLQITFWPIRIHMPLLLK